MAFTYSGSKGVYTVWDESNGEVRSYGTMRKAGNVWRIYPEGFGNSYIAEGKTRDMALAALIVVTAATAEKSTIVVDAKMAIQSLRDAVAERGEDFVYRDYNSGTFKANKNDGVGRGFAPSLRESGVCVYAWKGAPSCGVGVGLSLLGVPVSDLEAMDKRRNAVHGTAIGTVNLPDGLELTKEARMIYSEFQLKQDNCYSWRVALSAAESVAQQLVMV